MEEVEMEAENSRFWSEITSNEYLFTRLDMEAEMIGRLTKEEVLNFYTDVMLNAPKLSIQVIGNRESECEEEVSREDEIALLKVLNLDIKNGEKVIDNIGNFKNSLEFYDPCTTVVDL